MGQGQNHTFFTMTLQTFRDLQRPSVLVSVSVPLKGVLTPVFGLNIILVFASPAHRKALAEVLNGLRRVERISFCSHLS